VPLACAGPVSESEHQAQGALDNTRSPADDARGCAHSSCGAAAQRGCNFAEVHTTLAANRIGKVGVVKEVEEVRFEAQMNSFRTQREEFRSGKIPVL